jgi:hypothetical protein
LLEEPLLEAALMTFLLKSTFFSDFLLFSQNPKAAKRSSDEKQASKRKTKQILNEVLAVPLYVPLQTEKELPKTNGQTKKLNVM